MLFVEVFIYAFMAAEVLIILAGITVCVNNYKGWMKVKNVEPVKKSLISDSYLDEMESVVRIIEERTGLMPVITSESQKDLDSLRVSSDIASLFRKAHQAGCHITFEQNTVAWKDDPEYLDPDVFKTDMSEAADMRDQRSVQKYKRYYDPPRSRRDRKLVENGIISYEETCHGCHRRVVHRG